ncbi:MAG: PD-(D/E)XK nuclease family protein, partial [Parvularcula sp.]|nr:PD-(D/E)XK nuclease family protein [Parvularcula sp.]
REQISGAERDQLAAAVIALLERPDLRPLFCEGGLPEVAIQGEYKGTPVSGQIDRLIISDRQVTAVEFKSSRWVPKTLAAVPAAHRRQAQTYCGLLRSLYPEKDVRGVLVYTAAPRLFHVVEE